MQHAISARRGNDPFGKVYLREEIKTERTNNKMELNRKEIIEIRESSLMKAKKMSFSSNQRLYVLMAFLCDELLENMGPSNENPQLIVNLVLSKVSHQQDILDDSP